MLAQKIRDRADVIFVAVGQPQRLIASWLFAEVAKIGANHVRPKGMIGERHTTVDQQTMVTTLDRHAIHADLSQSSERNQSNSLRHDLPWAGI
jgi:hypothetical protein